MDFIEIGGTKLYLEDESLNSQDFNFAMNKIKEVAKEKGFIVREYQISGNFSPFGSSGQYPIFQVGKGRGSKRIEWLVHISKQEYSKNKRFRSLCTQKGRYLSTFQSPTTQSQYINNEKELLLSLHTILNELQNI